MNDRLIRLPELIRVSGLSASTVRRLEAQGVFPRRLRVSANVVAWRLHEVIAWLETRTANAVSAPRNSN